MRPYCWDSIISTDFGPLESNVWHPHFRRVTLGLECSEESLLSTEDLDGRGWVLGQIGKGTSGKKVACSATGWT